MKIVYFGLPLAALFLAEDGHELELAVLAPVAEAPGRRRLIRRLGAGAVLEASADLERALAGRKADLLVSWFWTRRLPERWLSAPRLGAIGVHPSLLPRHRGPNPFFWAIDSGDEWTGVTVHRLTAEYDTGEMLEQLAIPVGELNAWQLARALDRPSLCALRAVVHRLARGDSIVGRAQDERGATWAAEPDGELLRADRSWPTERVLRRIRALAPVPGLALEIRGVQFFVTRASPAACPAALLPGEAAVTGAPPSRVVLRTADGGVGIDAALLAGADDPSEGREIDGAELAAVIARAATSVLD